MKGVVIGLVAITLTIFTILLSIAVNQFIFPPKIVQKEAYCFDDGGYSTKECIKLNFDSNKVGDFNH